MTRTCYRSKLWAESTIRMAWIKMAEHGLGREEHYCVLTQHTKHICVHIQLWQYWLYMDCKQSACTPSHMFRSEAREARRIIGSVWMALVLSREYGIYRPQSQKNLDYKPRSWCEVCLSLQLRDLGTCTRCKFNPGTKVTRFNDINNFWWFLSFFVSPANPDTQQLEKQRFIWRICETTGRSRSCTDESGSPGSVGWL